MENICDVRLETVEDSNWIHIKQVNYKQNGVKKTKEITFSHDSCAILIHNASRDVFVFVRQFRPAVFMHEVGWKMLSVNSKQCVNPSSEQLKSGFTLELCAGIIDKEGKSSSQIAAEEVLEECGYRIAADKLEYILATRNNSLHRGTLQHLYYARVTDDMKAVGWGGGNRQEGEFIEIVEFKVGDVLKSIFEDMLLKPLGLTFSLVWFFLNKSPSSSSASKSPPKSFHLPLRDDNDLPGSSDKRKRYNENTISRRTKKPKTEKSNPYNCNGMGLHVTDVEVTDERSSHELQIYRLYFKQQDFKKTWDFLFMKNVCATLVHNTSRNVFVLVRKFSAAVYGSLHLQAAGSREVKPSEACLIQLCSVSYERELHPCLSASDDIHKIMGYKVPSKEFQKIITSRSDVGTGGSLLTLFYVKVTDEMKDAEYDNSVECESEGLEIVEVPVTNDQGDAVMDGLEMAQEKNPMSLSLALLWYYYHHQNAGT